MVASRLGSLAAVGILLLTGRLLMAGDLPEGALVRLGSTSFRHGGTVRAVAYAPDGRLLASAGDDHAVRLWEPATGAERGRLDGHLREVRCLAFSPDGRLLASAGDDRDVCLWDVASGKETRRLEGHRDSVTALVFTTDSRSVVSGSSDRSVRVWDVRQGTGRLLFTEHPVGAVAVAPDGKLLAVADGDGLLFWDLPGDRPVRRVAGPWVASLAFSPDSTTVASGEWSGRVSLWNATAQSVQRRTVAENQGEVRCLAYSADGKSLAWGGSGRAVRLWDLGTGQERGRLEGHHDTVTALAFSPDGLRLASGGADHTVRVWDPAAGREAVATSGHRAAVTCAAFAPDGRSLLTGSRDGTLRLWDAGAGKEGRQFAGHQDPVRCAAFATDGRLLASGGDDQTVRLWDPATGREVRCLTGHRNTVAALAFSPDGRLLASGGHDKALRLWDVTSSRQLAEYPAVPGWVVSVGFTRDGKGLVCASSDNLVRIRELGAAGDPIVPSYDLLGPHPGGLLAMAVTGDGRTVATAGKDRKVRLWDVAGQKERSLLRGHPSWVGALAVSPDGSLLVSGGADGLLCLWDVAGGKEVGRLAAHAGPVEAIAFSPAGDRLATAGADTTALIWAVPDLVRAARPHPVRLAERELDRLWRELADDDADRAYQATRPLVAGAGQSVPFLKEHVRPIGTERLARLLRDLDDSDFGVREQAFAELERLGNLVEPALHKALEAGPSPEVRRRVERLLEKLADPTATGDRQRPFRAIEVLEQVGSPEARAVLRELAAGAADAELTRRAQAALARAERHP